MKTSIPISNSESKDMSVDRLNGVEAELKLAQALLQDAELIGKMGAWEVDINTRKVTWSRGVYRIREVDDLSKDINLDIGMENYIPESKLLLDAAVKRAIEFDEPYDLELELITAKGNRKWVHTIGKKYPEEHKLRGFFQDITDRKVLEIELKRQAQIDYLTGVNNLRHFMERAEFEFIRSVRYSTPLSALILDIDHFKLINDSYGHKAGDEVLKKLASICKEMLRDVDIVGRIGGEEFAILLPETDQLKAEEVAERLRNIIANTDVMLEALMLSVSFTASFGVAALAGHDKVSDLLNFADKALYQAKNSGRNRVCVDGQNLYLTTQSGLQQQL